MKSIQHNRKFIIECCGESQLKRNGKCRRGIQRWKCKNCGKTRGDPTNRVFVFSRLEPDVDTQIIKLLFDGKSIREIRAITGVSKKGIADRRNIVFDRDLYAPKGSKSKTDCHYCGKEVFVKKEFKRRTARVNHMFCDSTCYQNYEIVTDDMKLTNYLYKKLRDQERHDMTKATRNDGKLTKRINSTADLRTVLIETIQGVREGDIDYKQGNTIAALSKAVLQSAKLDFEVFRFHEAEKIDENQKLKSISLSS